MSTHREKEVELRYLSRPTLQQLAKQHNIKANLKSTELVCELLKCWPCKVHSPECMLVQSASSDDDEFNTSMSAPQSSQSSNAPPSLVVGASVHSALVAHNPASPLSSPRVYFQLPATTSAYSPDSDLLLPTLPALTSPSSEQRARRRTWNIAEVQIGDRLLSPFRGGEHTRHTTKDRRMSVRQSVGLAMMEEEDEEGGEREGGGERTAFEAANVQQTLRFSTLTEEGESVDTGTSQPASTVPPAPSTRHPATSTSPNCPAWTTGSTASEKPAQFVGFINTSRRGGRPAAVRQSIRLSSRRQTIASTSSASSPAAVRRQTIALSSTSTTSTSTTNGGATAWPVTAGPRPLRPTSTITTNNPAARPAVGPTKPKPRFDVAASLARPVTWKMHKGPLTERVLNGGSGGVKAEGKANMEREKGGKEEVRVRQRREMRQRSIDYARNVRVGQRAGQENTAPAVKQQ